jgi:hypothetical protein
LTSAHFERGEVVGNLLHLTQSGHFREYDAVGSALPFVRHDRREILQQESARERVDADPELLLGTVRLGSQQLTHSRPSRGELADVDGILEIEDQRVGCGGERLGLLAFAIARNE